MKKFEEDKQVDEGVVNEIKKRTEKEAETRFEEAEAKRHEPVNTEEAEKIRDKIIEKHGGYGCDHTFTPSAKAIVLQKFESTLASCEKEGAELTKQIKRLKTTLSKLYDKQDHLQIVLDTLRWLNEEVFSTDELRKTISSALLSGKNEDDGVIEDGATNEDIRRKRFGTHSSLLKRLDILQNSEALDGRQLAAIHDATNNNGYYYKCPTCGWSFRDEADLAEHIKTKCEYKDDLNARMECLKHREAICTDRQEVWKHDHGFSENDLGDSSGYMNSSISGVILVQVCPDCGSAFKDADALAEHRKTECKYREKHGETEPIDMLHCYICGFDAKSTGGLAVHVRAKHPKHPKHMSTGKGIQHVVKKVKIKKVVRRKNSLKTKKIIKKKVTRKNKKVKK